MKHDTEKYRQIFASMSPEAVEEMNQKNDDEHQRQATAFKEGYKKDICYLCGKPFKTISKENPCLHWLLRQCKFKKKDFPKIYKKYGYGNLAAFIRWCANQKRLHSSINDLEEEKSDRKVLSYTVKWKNIEWTFDCSKNDFIGHEGTTIDFPHYHFQMRIDGRQFINFNDFHVPFTDEDVFVLKNSLEQGDCFKHNFGAIGSGMQDAVTIDPDLALEYMSNADEDDATYHLSTTIEAIDKPIPGELIDEIRQESLETGKSMTLIAKEKLKGIAIVKTSISPADSIPDIASRTEHKRR
ncbi:hypothetical protein [uncultured Shewanella sp.]|uniref:hypothetical protein n=1 Tax=uncultured Shewanella sp. TaxID=173975 RepID=UPI002626B3F5|nr:hypothetical protein [uncultured Shewanella sp.]